MTTAAAFLLGLPLAAGLLTLIHFGPLAHPLVQRYVSHPVEYVEVVLFCCALGALAAKLWNVLTERAACRTEVLPAWDGRPVPVAEAGRLRAGLHQLARRLHNTYLVRRVSAVLDFVASRGSAAGLDDQLRGLADNDVLAQEGSYALTRFITWAIPILGFLGTVLGITGAISGVTPERLEHDLSTVTDGLALAFDATALALALTMVTMFFSFVVERAEQGVLEAVDRYADGQLAHRFERGGVDGGEFTAVVREHTGVLLRATEQLVNRQAEVWAKTLEAAEKRWAEAGERHEQRLTAALEAALETTLEAHARRLAELEKRAGEQNTGLLGQVAELAAALRDTGKDQQAGLTLAVQAVTAQAETLARLQEGEKQLVRLQETLNYNLTALAGAGAFEQAVHSLTAAIHLLTARTAAPAGGGGGRLGPRPGAAA
jgi:hypothetical protein